MSNPILERAAQHGVTLEMRGAVAVVTLRRPAKRNALSDSLIEAIRDTFQNLPAEAKAAVIDGEGEHFCAGLDLSELKERDAGEGVHHSRNWHVALDAVQYGRVPVIAALHGAVVGGGLELASAAHIRVADESTFYALPEGTRGIFVGGGGSVRVPKLIGVARMTDMMLTGRVLDAQEGERRGLSQYVVADGTGFAKGCELAARIAGNAPLSNFSVVQALPRIADLSQSDGLFVESLMSSIAQGDEAAKERVRAFLEKRAGKVEKKA